MRCEVLVMCQGGRTLGLHWSYGPASGHGSAGTAPTLPVAAEPVVSLASTRLPCTRRHPTSHFVFLPSYLVTGVMAKTDTLPIGYSFTLYEFYLCRGPCHDTQGDSSIAGDMGAAY